MTAVGLDNGQIRFWDVAGWTCRKTLREHKKGVTDLKVDAKGLLLVSAAGR
jgi:WD40 repeat protein